MTDEKNYEVLKVDTKFPPFKHFRPFLVDLYTGEEMRFFVDSYENKYIVTDRKRLQHGCKTIRGRRYWKVGAIKGSQVSAFVATYERDFNTKRYELRFLTTKRNDFRETRVCYWPTNGRAGIKKKDKKHKPRKKALPPYNPIQGEFDGRKS